MIGLFFIKSVLSAQQGAHRKAPELELTPSRI